MDATLIISIVSISLTFILGIWNIKIARETHFMRKDEFFRKQIKDAKEEFDNRPKFEIVERKYGEGSVDQDEEYDIECLVAKIEHYEKVNEVPTFDYNVKILNKDEWVYYIFKLKNAGKSTINDMCIAWNMPRKISLFDVKDDLYVSFIGNKYLNYRVSLDKFIKADDVITIKINFHKNMIPAGIISAEASLWLFDEYNKVWRQPLFVHTNKIYDAIALSYSDFKDSTGINKALECFEKPYLW